MSVIRPKGYEYTGVLKAPAYFRKLVERELGLPVLGITSTPTKFIIFFERDLTDVEKATLDSLVAENPVPVSEYEFSRITEDDVETEIGVRPVLLTIDPITGMARVYFDTTLTLEQEAKLEASLRVPMRFKRRKP